MSRPGVDESKKWDFIKVILTKNQGRGKRNKKWMRIRKSRCVESDRTNYCTGKFNAVLSLCGVLGVTFYFSKGFLEAAARGLAVAETLQPLGMTVVCFLGQKSNLLLWLKSFRVRTKDNSCIGVYKRTRWSSFYKLVYLIYLSIMVHAKLFLIYPKGHMVIVRVTHVVTMLDDIILFWKLIHPSLCHLICDLWQCHTFVFFTLFLYKIK